LWQTFTPDKEFTGLCLALKNSITYGSISQIPLSSDAILHFHISHTKSLHLIFLPHHPNLFIYRLSNPLPFHLSDEQSFSDCKQKLFIKSFQRTSKRIYAFHSHQCTFDNKHSFLTVEVVKVLSCLLYSR